MNKISRKTEKRRRKSESFRSLGLDLEKVRPSFGAPRVVFEEKESVKGGNF